MSRARIPFVVVALLIGSASLSPAPAAEKASATPASSYVPDLGALISQPASELRDVLQRYRSDRFALQRRFDVPHSRTRAEHLRSFYSAWRQALEKIEFDALGQEGRIDYVLFRNHLDYRLRRLDHEARVREDVGPLIPFAETIVELQEARRRLEPIDAESAAATLVELEQRIEWVRKGVDAGRKASTEPAADDDKKPGRKKKEPAAPAAAATDTDDEPEPIETTRTLAHRASRILDDMRETLKDWYRYFDGYDPMFSWWTADPYEKGDKALEDYAEFLREKIVGHKAGEDPPIVGDPIGREALLDDLASELIPYTPEELVAVAEREFAWCEKEMLRASRDLGHGDDWAAALEHVKGLHVGPGEQPELIRFLAFEAVDFLEQRKLLTVPPLARDVWRMEMMSPERQKIAPFFLGGEVIQVSFPTDTMTHEEKRMSMRGNNKHFSRATVHHELIPGHHLQGFMNERYASHRGIFRTPFWTEGWALYWEMVLWDLGFPKTAEDRIGMLFWRMHRCARIIFSLGFHLGTMTPQECIDFLVERVGHERANATAEVRRSFEGSYPPLYQLAYMMGALQFRALRQELVDSGRMGEREFHDAILQGGTMPVEMVRARLTGTPLTREFRSGWRFYGDPAD